MDMKELASELLKELGPALINIAEKAVEAKLPPAAARVVEIALETTEDVFVRNNPGTGGAPPEPLQLSETDENVVATFTARLNALEAKVDALVQATGHGNSAALAAHL